MARPRKNENPKGNTRDVNAANRVSLALQLRLQKLSYEEIAQRVGYASKGACHNAIQREMQRIVANGVETLRSEELLILDKLHAETWEMAMDRNNKGRLFAVDRLIEISKERRKLMGLDSQAKGDIQNNNMVVVREIPVGYFGEVQKSE